MLSNKEDTQIVLGNAAQLALGIVKCALGNDASDKVGNVELNDAVLLSMIEARLQHNIAMHVGNGE